MEDRARRCFRVVVGVVSSRVVRRMHERKGFNCGVCRLRSVAFGDELLFLDDFSMNAMMNYSR